MCAWESTFLIDVDINHSLRKADMAKRQATKQPRKRAGAQTANDAVALLAADHRRVEELFAKWESESSADKKRKIVAQVCDELIMHAMLEEELFYAACREHAVEGTSLNEAQVEHDAAKILIADLQAASADEFADAKVTVLKEYIKHHVAEEEQPRHGIFARARAAGVDLAALGTQLRERKEQLVQLQAEQGLPQPTPRALQLPLLTNQDRKSGDTYMARQDDSTAINGIATKKTIAIRAAARRVGRPAVAATVAARAAMNGSVTSRGGS